MRRVEILDTDPTVIHCNINIAHPQLRDLLQPAGEKGKVLFVNGLRIDCADFATEKVPTTFSNLDFAAVCLTTGSGLVAAGGQQSELDIRPLLPLPTSCNDSNGESSASGASSSTDDLLTNRHSPRWHLRTPTGGTINNSICIQPDVSRLVSSSNSVHGSAIMSGLIASSEDKDLCRHREKRRKEISEAMQEDEEIMSAWRRDDPSGRMGSETRGSEERADFKQQGIDAILERNKIGIFASEDERRRRREEKTKMQRGQVFSDGLMRPSPLIQSHVSGSSVRVLVSNNDQSVKEFRLRPPTRSKSTNGIDSGGAERIESGLPGLSRLQTVEFPTCINHSSFSPDGRHLVSVGDTPEVFLYSVDPVTGGLTQIATYTASSDASFSTSWSPDGMQFAVASQDGLVSVWDVRSASKVASLQTSHISAIRGLAAARVVKWSPRGDLLAFSEHKNYVHVVETSTFNSSQKIKVPSGMTGREKEDRVCEAASAETRETSGRESMAADEVDVDDMLHSSTDTSGSQALPDSAVLESTSPARFATSGRNSAANNAAINARPWLSARRYRDIGSNSAMRSPLDRALLGEWSSSRRGGGGGGGSSNSQLEIYIDDRDTTSSSSSRSSQPTSTSRTSQLTSSSISSQPTSLSRSSLPPATDTSTTMLARTVDSIMATFENDNGLHGGSNLWSLGGISRRVHRSEDSIDISGLTWDPDGDHLYVSTNDLIARYSVLDLRRSFGQAVMR